jgi:hypothetical protein
MNENNSAKQWVETHYPTARGTLKSMLILAYGAGLDAGLAEAQHVIKDYAHVMKDFANDLMDQISKSEPQSHQSEISDPSQTGCT